MQIQANCQSLSNLWETLHLFSLPWESARCECISLPYKFMKLSQFVIRQYEFYVLSKQLLTKQQHTSTNSTQSLQTQSKSCCFHFFFQASAFIVI